jgi:hypothetical protein
MNGHLGSIAGSLGKVVTTLDHSRPHIDRAAKAAASPVGRLVTRAAARR